MKNFTPYEKLSKKQQRELNNLKRTTWGITNPVTRTIESKKIYNRKRIRNEFDNPHHPDSFIYKNIMKACL